MPPFSCQHQWMDLGPLINRRQILERESIGKGIRPKFEKDSESPCRQPKDSRSARMLAIMEMKNQPQGRTRNRPVGEDSQSIFTKCSLTRYQNVKGTGIIAKKAAF